MDGFYRHRVPRIQDFDVRGDAADPGELRRVELHALPAQDLVLRDALIEQPERGAVLGRDTIQIVGGNHAVGTRHVRYDHALVAGNVLADVTGEQPRILIVAAARAERHVERDGLA